MSRNGSGTFSIPNTLVSGTPITAAAHNQNYADIGSEITNSLALDGQSTMTGPIKAASGSVSAPSVTFGSDPDSGFYRIGSNNMGGAVGGTKILDVSTSGLVVVGDLSAATVKQNGNALMPAGIILPYAGSAAPDGYLLCYGQAVSRSTYAALFSAIGTTYGVGDASTTFNVPDLRGRVIAGQDDMGGSSADRLTGQANGVDGDVLGGTGGTESQTLSIAQLPTVTPAGTIVNVVTNARHDSSSGNTVSGTGGSASPDANTVTRTDTAVNSTFTGTPFGSGSAHNNVQPTLILNYIVKI